MTLAFSTAEIASIYPTAGGQYHWVASLAPKGHEKAASWFTGWVTIGGQIVVAASAAFAGGLQLQALITINNINTYTAERWQGTLFLWAVLMYGMLINIFGSKVLPHVNMLCGLSS